MNLGVEYLGKPFENPFILAAFVLATSMFNTVSPIFNVLETNIS